MVLISSTAGLYMHAIIPKYRVSFGVYKGILEKLPWRCWAAIHDDCRGVHSLEAVHSHA